MRHRHTYPMRRLRTGHGQRMCQAQVGGVKGKVLMLASVASMIGQFNMQNIRLLLEMGYEVHVACNFKEGNTCDAKQVRRLRQDLRSMHVRCHQWDCPRSAYAPCKCRKAYLQLMGLAGRHHFLWIHCHSPVGGALARLVAHKRKVRAIYTAHGFHFYKGAPIKNWLLYYPVEKLLSRWTDVLVTVNQEDYRLARRKLKAGRVCLIPGVGVDVQKYARGGRIGADTQKYLHGSGQMQEREAFCKEFGIPKGAYILLSVGELNKGKNHKLAISALKKLKRQDVCYLICGRGKLQKKLQKYADKIGVGGRVRLPGFWEDMPWIYQNADIFVFPSMREGMPVALMEAMAAGLPCVVSDIRGNRELIANAPCFGGVRISYRSARQLSEALELLLSDARLRQMCGDCNQQKIKKYSQDIVRQRMEGIYHSLAREIYQ